MKKSAKILFTISLLLWGSLTMAQNASLRKIETIDGNSYLAIHAAMNIFQEYKPDLAKYKIRISYRSDLIIVSFVNIDKNNEIRGAIGPQPEFSVTLNASNFMVIKSQFIR